MLVDSFLFSFVLIFGSRPCRQKLFHRRRTEQSRDYVPTSGLVYETSHFHGVQRKRGGLVHHMLLEQELGDSTAVRTPMLHVSTAKTLCYNTKRYAIVETLFLIPISPRPNT